MAEFTKGKWNVGEEEGYLYISAEKENVCTVWTGSRDDARLIAAAPEMYDELYEALQLLKGKSSYDNDEFAQQARSIEELLSRIDGHEQENDTNEGA